MVSFAVMSKTTAHRREHARVPVFALARTGRRRVPGRAQASTASSASAPRDGKVLVPPLEYDPNTGDALERAGRGRARGHRRVVDVGRRTDAEASARPSVRVRAGHTRRRRHRDGARGRRGQHRQDVDRHARAAALARRSAQHDRRPRVLGARMTDVSTPKENLVMNHLVSLTYSEELTPILERYVDALIDGRIVGHKCPRAGACTCPARATARSASCRPPSKDEFEVSDHGTVTGFTIITPVAYYGQTETEPFVYASVLLDGSSGNLGGQDIIGVPHDQAAFGHARASGVEAEERAQRRRGVEPRVGERRFGDRRVRVDRRARRGPVRVRGAHLLMAATDIAIVGYAQTPSVRTRARERSAVARPDRHRGVGDAPVSTGARSASRARGRATTSPADRSRSCRTSRPRARGRRSRSHTSRWTARGRCTRRGCACSTATSTPRSCSARASRRRRSPTRCGRSSSTRTTSRRWASTRRRWPASRRGRCSTRARRPSATSPRSWRATGATPRTIRTRRWPATTRSTTLLRGAVRARAVAQRTTSRRSPTARSRSCWPAATRPGRCATGPRGSAGLDHRIEVHQPGMRDLTSSPSTTLAARKAGYDGGPLDVSSSRRRSARRS